MRLGILLIFTLFCTSVICQFTEDFEDGDLSVQPKWDGNTDHFITNAEGMLQLAASAAGRSFIYTTAPFPDSFSFSFVHTLDFSPSASNYSRIYFLLDNADPSKANGYYLNFGENGSVDAIRLYELKSGTSTLLASGVAGRIALNSNPFELKMEYGANQTLSVSADFGGSGTFENQFSLQLPLQTKAGQIFAYECVYTASRTDKFLLDDLLVEVYAPDLTPPALTGIQVSDDGQILTVTFSEPIQADAAVASNFQLNPAGVNIQSVSFETGSTSKLSVFLDRALTTNQVYTLQLALVKDLRGNATTDLISQPFSIYAKPQAGTILLSEILFDPVSNGFDFLELYNQSNESINLKGLIIKNEGNNTSRTISTDLIMEAGSYLALSANPQQIRTQYQPPSTARIIAFDLPAFNNSDGHPALYFPDEATLLDDFMYSESFHNPLIDDTEGVSLERISFEKAFGDGNYASAAANVLFATPGYENSNHLAALPNGTEYFNLVAKRFSPDGDGYEDQLLIAYELPEPGFLLNLKIFDANGQYIRTLANNELLGLNGFIKWNGDNDEGIVERMGIYILKGTYHSLNGTTGEINKTCILANKL